MLYENLFLITIFSIIIILYYFTKRIADDREKILTCAEKMAQNNQIEKAVKIIEQYDSSYETWLNDPDLSDRVIQITHSYAIYLERLVDRAENQTAIKSLEAKKNFYEHLNQQIAI